jgi:MOSC domain-containing protein YiiM
MGRLVSIVYKPGDSPGPAQGYDRAPLQEARLLARHGIEGDAKGGVGGRNLNIMSAETLREMAAEGFSTLPGEMGEQIVVSGVDVDTLPDGTRLRIGEAACVDIVRPRTPCATFERHQGKPREQAAGRIGMMAEVSVGGTIAVGDPVVVLAAEPALPL